MESCPNCHGTVRAGSRFCTACGFRLPDAVESPAADDGATLATDDAPAPSTEAPPPWAPATDDVEDTPTSLVTASTPSPAQPEHQLDDGTADPDGGDVSPDAVSLPEPTAPAWPGWDDVEPVVGPGTGSPDDENGAGDSPSALVWSGLPEAPAGPRPEAFAEDVVVSVGTSGEWPVAAPDEAATARGYLTGPAPAGASLSSSPRPIDDIDSPRSSDVGDLAEAGRTTLGTPATPVESTDAAIDGATEGAGPAADSIQRALLMLDELRLLVGEIQISGSDVPDATSPQGVIETLRAARPSERAGADFSGLATVLAAVRDRPRDIDAMLQLLGRLDDLIALQDAYGHCQEAIETALGQLGPGGSGSPAVRFRS